VDSAAKFDGKSLKAKFVKVEADSMGKAEVYPIESLNAYADSMGKTYNGGESIGKIDVLEGYKLVANVDEFYLDRIVLGQKGQVESKGQLIQVEVSKILPEIINGRFEVQLNFVNQDNLKLQEGNSMGIKLFLSGKEQRLLLAKGSFMTDTKGEWVYVVKEGKAERRQVKSIYKGRDFRSCMGQ